MNTLPLDGLAGLRQNWRQDLLSGFLVFLIALPLCLGIALASGVPPLAGIIAAVIGGTVVSMISGSYVTINGPAAGLIVVILSSVESLGGSDRLLGYRLTLAAIVVAGLIQILLGLSRAGRLSSFFPSAAVHGLLASIGIVIMAKQSYVMFGLKAQGSQALRQIFQLPAALAGANPEIAFIGISTLILVALLPKIPGLKRLPAPLLGVMWGMLLGRLLDLEHEHTYLAFVNHQYHIGPEFLVTLPGRILDGLVHPDWSHLGYRVFWQNVAMIAIIASLETLLSATAVDKLDPYARKSNLDRDLTAIGVGTVCSGLLGGLPMIAEIVRSSANVNNGARTRWANFFHGLCMLLFVVFAPGLIHRIPLASLAAILCLVGFRLASPREFRKTWEVGPDQMLIFLTTIAMTLATDLLVGIFSGVAAKLILHLVRGVGPRQLLHCQCEIQEQPEGLEVKLGGALTFTQILQLQSRLAHLPTGRSVTLDLSRTHFVDHSCMEYLEQFEHDYTRTGGSIHLVGLEAHQSASGHPLACRRRTA